MPKSLKPFGIMININSKRMFDADNPRSSSKDRIDFGTSFTLWESRRTPDTAL
jgi:hypothetical protein